MSEVHLLSVDPEKRSATFRWISSGLRRLNRANKVSSATFATPANVSTHNQTFRVVVLRGVVKAPVEQDDPFAIFVEYLPSATEVPGGVHVNFTIGPPEHTNRVSTQVTGNLNSTERNLGVKEIFTPAEYETLCFPETDALCIDVTLTFEVAVLDTVVRASKSLGSSLWGGASSTFSTFGSRLASWGGKVTHLLDDTFHFGREEAPAQSSMNTECPWDTVPSKWIDRPHRWSFFLTQYLPQNDNVFLVGPRGFTSEEELLLIEAGLSANACVAAANEFHFDADVHPGLLGTEQRLLRSMRFDLVPSHVTEQDFWRNYFWRIHCLKLCGTDEQAQILLSILNAPKKHESPQATIADAWRVAALNCETACSLCEEILDESVTDANAEMLKAATASVALAIETLSAIKAATNEDDTFVRGTVERGESTLRRCQLAIEQYELSKAAPAPVKQDESKEEAKQTSPQAQKEESQADEVHATQSAPVLTTPNQSPQETTQQPRAASEPAAAAVKFPWEDEE